MIITSKGGEIMDPVTQAYIAGWLVGFLTYVTMRTVWKCFTEDEKGGLDHEKTGARSYYAHQGKLK